jgi:Fe-S-cluster containining protein
VSVSVTTALRQAYESVDAAFASHLVNIGMKPSCSVGCSACCEQLALVTWPEAMLVAEAMLARGFFDTEIAAIAAQAEACFYEGIDPGSYWDRRVRCALLTDENRCSVYEARPAACRYHVAFTPAAMCSSRAPGRNTQHVDTGPVIEATLGPIMEELAAAGAEQAHEFGPLPVMLIAALRDELGVPVPRIPSPREWMNRHGRQVYEYVKADLAEARAAGREP